MNSALRKTSNHRKIELHDLRTHKQPKGGGGNGSSEPVNSSAVMVPESLDDFLKRDSLPIEH